jgi:glycosyltransferase involved in cell wall biosynthesis
MASGAPVVSTNVGGVPFIVRDCATALLVPPGDPAAMAEAAQRILEDPQLAARLHGAALADVQQYAWPKVRARWADLYASVLSRPGAREACAR